MTLQSTGVLVFFEEVTLLPGKPYEAAYNYVHRGSPMIMNFKATLFSDCYYGLDIEQLVPVKFVEFTGSRVHIYLYRKLNSIQWTRISREYQKIY